MELPNELWNEISLYMDYYDLFNFKLVSRDLCDSARKINNLDRIQMIRSKQKIPIDKYLNENSFNLKKINLQKRTHTFTITRNNYTYIVLDNIDNNYMENFKLNIPDDKIVDIKLYIGGARITTIPGKIFNVLRKLYNLQDNVLPFPFIKSCVYHYISFELNTTIDIGTNVELQYDIFQSTINFNDKYLSHFPVIWIDDLCWLVNYIILPKSEHKIFEIHCPNYKLSFNLDELKVIDDYVIINLTKSLNYNDILKYGLNMFGIDYLLKLDDKYYKRETLNFYAVISNILCYQDGMGGLIYGN